LSDGRRLEIKKAARATVASRYALDAVLSDQVSFYQACIDQQQQLEIGRGL
jgi:hypothetical protein